MKKLFVLLCLFFIAMGYGQKIRYEKGKFYQNGDQISTYETKQKVITNHEAYQYFKASKTKEGVGGFLLGLGIGLTVGDAVKGLVSDTEYPSGFTYAGGALMVASIPILSGRTKKMEKAIELYNKNLQPTLGYQEKKNFSMNLIANTNGYGFQILF